MNAPETVSAPDAVETDITDETYFVSNGEFLLAVFGDELADARPVVVSFAGNPASAPGRVWFGRPWQGNPEMSACLPASANNYFSLAVFRPDDSGQFRRQMARFQALHVVMLDDVGTKVAMERLTLPPSWLLETSAGNHQAGYLLRKPLTDGSAADRLMNAIVAAGLCDPGANGPRARLARLPEAVNDKHMPPFQCRMVEWTPELRYSVDELVDGLQLEMAPAGRPKRQNARPAQERHGDGDPVWIPRPEENAVLVALQNRGLYKAPLGDGKHDTTCPWVKEHTGEVNSGTAYFEPDDNWPIGGFKCLHGHCAERHIRDLLRFVDVEVNAARMKPTIRVMAGEIHRVVDAAERELAQSRRHYQRGGLIVTVVTDPGTRETRVQDISQPALVRALAGAATWEKFDARSADWMRTDPPARHAAVLFDSTSYHHLPVLSGLARQPYLRPDGSLMMAAGYDPSTGMFGVFDTREFSIPESPTHAEAEAALALLKDLLMEFSFARDTDLAGCLGRDANGRRPAQPDPCANDPRTGAHGGFRQVVPLRADHGFYHAAAGNAHHISRRRRGMPEAAAGRVVARSGGDRVRQSHRRSGGAQEPVHGADFRIHERAHPGRFQDGYRQYPRLVPVQRQQRGTGAGYDPALHHDPPGPRL